MNQGLITVLYRSVAKLKQHSRAETEMIEQARASNARLGISGFLHREDDVFFQVFEGLADAANALLGRILADSRHTMIEVLERRPILVRAFDGWTMGYSTKGDRSMFDWSVAKGIPLRPVDPADIRSFLLSQAQASEHS
ncbi:BLUF domain-containing protein [Paracoccus sp. N5]|uniref:BLUF domain-containing protein n=1 Tax=Paracoccus sp. N5 TaxID=1101189 RepID=UPI00037EEF4C|nr:BLUF domain-containing protein [Paracoccus sp. N5]